MHADMMTVWCRFVKVSVIIADEAKMCVGVVACFLFVVFVL